MILSLDHLIFGNGFGMASPFFDARYYWLVDTRLKERNGRNGQLYQFNSGFGAQLRSHQWTHPRAGERRCLAGREFVVFHSARRWLRVEVAWSWVDLPRDINEANAELRKLAAEIGE